MKILGIDTIFHDVCAAVMENDKVLSNEKISTSISSTSKLLLNFTSVHVKEIGEVLDQALKKANVSLDDISLIAVNNSGSLLSNVLVGLITANTLAYTKNIPIVDVGHQEAHIFSNWIERNADDFDFPILVFSASGGHSLYALISSNSFNFSILSEVKGIKGYSKSQAEFAGIGFLFSRVVIELGLIKSPGRLNGDGNFIAQLAAKGNAQRFNLLLKQKKVNSDCQFNFNELMNKVSWVIKKEKIKIKILSDEFIFDLAASFEDALSEIIANNTLLLAEECKVKEIHLVGGVSANETIRNKFVEKASLPEFKVRYPQRKAYCTDNAAMIANLGYCKFLQTPQKYIHQRHLGIKSDLVLERLAVDQFIKQNKGLD